MKNEKYGYAIPWKLPDNKLTESQKAVIAKCYTEKVEVVIPQKEEERVTTPFRVKDYAPLDNDAVAVMKHNASILLTKLKEKDRVSYEHSVRVGEMVHRYWKEKGIDKPLLDELTVGAQLHDIGKLVTDENVLKANRRLSDEEFRVMKQHVRSGYDLLGIMAKNNIICKELTKSDVVKYTILEHHESYAGGGYPDPKLKGEMLSDVGRVCAVFDEFDAIRNKRQYKEEYSLEQTLRFLKEDRKLDQNLVKEAIPIMRSYDKECHAHCYDAPKRVEELHLTYSKNLAFEEAKRMAILEAKLRAAHHEKSNRKEKTNDKHR